MPRGLVAQERWIRPVEEVGKKHTRRARALAEKESDKWLTSLAAVGAAKAACPRTHVISVGDAEADVYDLFLLERPAGVDLLVRAAQDRRLAEPDPEPPRRRVALAASAVAATVTLDVPRQGDRPARPAGRPLAARDAAPAQGARGGGARGGDGVGGVGHRDGRAPRRGASGLAAADHRAPAHHRGRTHLPGLVRLPLGHRGLSQSPQ